MHKNTIFAPATAPGKSGVAIIRISGAEAGRALKQLSGIESLAPNSTRFTAFHAPNGELIDRGIALFFKAPHSFTGEDVAELQVHGSPAVIRELLEVLSAIEGLRPAEAGEFTRRAFLNGKMDLVEAEGLADLIDAETSQQKSQAMRQMQGDLSRYYDALRKQITESLAHLEAYIDFPDEEIPESVLTGLGDNVDKIKSLIQETLQDHKRGERLREGMYVVILGAPNAGKSSLLNALAKKDAAIVSHRAGTTRDVIEVLLDIAVFPVILTDTAGLRESADDIEEEGVRRALARAADADLKLVVFDGAELPKLDPASLELIDSTALVVINKSDLNSAKPALDSISVSVKTGEGMNGLVKVMENSIISFFSSHAAPVITRNRHRALLQDTLTHLNRFKTGDSLELACEELRLAAQSVGKITGKIEVDELLDVIFRQFCIGK